MSSKKRTRDLKPAKNDDLNEFITVFQRIIASYLSLCANKGKKALEILSLLPKEYQNNSLVLSLTARSYFELHEYRKVKRY